MIRIKDIYREQFGQETPIKMQLASLSWEPVSIAISGLAGSTGWYPYKRTVGLNLTFSVNYSKIAKSRF